MKSRYLDSWMHFINAECLRADFLVTLSADLHGQCGSVPTLQRLRLTKRTVASPFDNSPRSSQKGNSKGEMRLDWRCGKPVPPFFFLNTSLLFYSQRGHTDGAIKRYVGHVGFHDRWLCCGRRNREEGAMTFDCCDFSSTMVVKFCPLGNAIA
ncbi:hypothetical protein CEXT_429471 [Caerostris extrusa]|uniref:Uncharacterized protein n=1 Tax=Caerostris extrusa TaxID=172846 RepID=A0AAV4SZ69_CAEEX|nr:hypothetical protein CEXT_429471 [Caerostris extrusa]